MKPIEVEPRVTKELNIVARDCKRDLVPCHPVGRMSIYVRELSGPVSSPNVLVHTYGVMWGVTWELMLGDFCEEKGLGTSSEYRVETKHSHGELDALARKSDGGR
jgi:hypothetical protein